MPIDVPPAKRYWMGTVPPKDDFGDTITNEFIDGKTKRGSWAFMTPRAFAVMGVGIGQGYGQRYVKQDDGRWLKVEG